MYPKLISKALIKAQNYVFSIPHAKYFIRLIQDKASLSTRNTWECHMKTTQQVQDRAPDQVLLACILHV